MKTRRNHRAGLNYPRSGRRSAGFTLLEMLVALTAGAAVISSVYFVSASSSRHFHEQQRIAQTQMSLRTAMAQLRRDLQRAGFGGTPNSENENTCVDPATEVQAIEFMDCFPGWCGGAPRPGSPLPNAVENRASDDVIRMVGNYSSPEIYLAAGLNSTGDTLYLQREWQSFRRSFCPSPTGCGYADINQDAFGEVFRVGRLLHIMTREGTHFFVTITDVTEAAASIEFNPPLEVGSGCPAGLADGAMVAPLSRVEYRIDNLNEGSAAGSRLASSSTGSNDVAAPDARGLVGSQLVRREVAFDTDGTPFPRTERVVLEYVATTDYEFIFDDATVPGVPPVLVRRGGADAQAAIIANPHRLRSAIVSLAVRTAEQNIQVPFVSPDGGLDGGGGDGGSTGGRRFGEPFTNYRVSDDGLGAARVRTLTSEVYLPNIAGRMMRPPP